MLGWTNRFIIVVYHILHRFLKCVIMKKMKSLNPVIGNEMSLVNHFQGVKRTISYPVVYHSRKRYAASEEEE